VNLGVQNLLLIYAFTPWTCDALASIARPHHALSYQPLPSTLLGSAKILPKQDPESLTLNRCSEVLHGSNTASDYPAEHTDTNCNSMWQLGVIKTAKWRKHIQRFVFRLWAGLCSI
jgi:hypothetical protein